jgi:hypothetical protein
LALLLVANASTQIQWHLPNSTANGLTVVLQLGNDRASSAQQKKPKVSPGKDILLTLQCRAEDNPILVAVKIALKKVGRLA